VIDKPAYSAFAGRVMAWDSPGDIIHLDDRQLQLRAFLVMR
jgi:hypothetical protein